MSNKKHSAIFLLLFVCKFGFSQKQTIHSKYFVKEKMVLIRWVPTDKNLFELGRKYGYKVTRNIKANNALSSSTVIAEHITPYASSDTSTWNSLIKKNEKGAFIYQSLYKNAIPSNIPQKEKVQQEKALYGLMLLSCDFHADIAKACGLFFTDSTVENKNTYVYTIEINDPPTSAKLTPTTIEVNASTLSTNPEISNLIASFKNKTVKLNWKASDFTSYYGGYNIERSVDNIEFHKINNAPTILLSSQFEKNKETIAYTDTLPKAKTIFYYRIKGINFFGEESAPSNVITGIGHEELRSTPIIDSLKVIKNKGVRLHWTMRDKSENTAPKEYVLMRSEKDNGKYSPIYRSATEFSFTDESPEQTNYYKIGAITHGNDTLFSFSRLALIADTIPPEAPVSLKAKVDSKGNVEITWDKNRENDIQGYKIYKANVLTEEFVQINNEFAKSPLYKDKLNLKTLSKKIYYCVAASDNNYNTSELSKPIEVKRPDTIPPVAPIIKNLQISQRGITIHWIPSSSEDANRYLLYHQDEKINADINVRSWSVSDTSTSFTDTTVEFGIGYKYKIVAMDEDDNISVSNSSYMFFETGFRKKITGINPEVDRIKKTITLKWNYPEKEIEKFIIYRAKAKEPLTIIKTIAAGNSAFEDKELNIGNTYEYRIKAVYTNGAESIISDAVRVEY